MNTLILTVGYGDPFLSHYAPTGETALRESSTQALVQRKGNTWIIADHQKWDHIILIALAGFEPHAQSTHNILRECYQNCTIDVHEVICGITACPTAIHAALERFISSLPAQMLTHLTIGFGEGMDAVNTAWYTLIASGKLKAKCLTVDRTLDAQCAQVPIAPASDCLSYEANEPSTLLLEDAAMQLGLIGEHPDFLKALSTASLLAEHPLPILIRGETGTGKGLIAKLIHALSPRAHKKWVAMNCGGLPETLSESVLFGHKKGAFTGAIEHEIGKFRFAEGGTLFLDEIGELPLKVQANLLRVIEEGWVEPVGAAQPVKVNVRIIAATHRNLEEAVKLGTFREDLYYRLNVGSITLPPLRERGSDMLTIAFRILERLNHTLKRSKQFSESSLSALKMYPWPGNIRELHNTLERSVLLTPGNILTPDDLFSQLKAHSLKDAIQMPQLSEGFSLEDYISQVRTQLILQALEYSDGNKSKAARLLGVTPQAVSKFIRNLSHRVEPAIAERN